MTACHIRIIPLATIFVALAPGVLVHAQQDPTPAACAQRQRWARGGCAQDCAQS